MSDVDDRKPRPEADRDPDTTLTEGSAEMLEPALDEIDPMPTGPNDDGSFGTDPPIEASKPRTSDDNDLDMAGEGMTEIPLRSEYESIARRNDLARQLEDLIVGAREWAQETGSDDAHAIAEELADIYERLGAPVDVENEIPDTA
jgi:hypothetical protein